MTHTDLWKRVKENLKKNHPQHAFSTWFEPIVSIGLNNDELILEVPNQFFFEWIQSHYKESIQLSVGEEYGKNIYIKYTVSPERGSPDEQRTTEIGRSYLPKDPQRKHNINREYTFASFIEGGHNQFAKAAALSTVDSLGKKAFNPLVIYGGVGMGKTHLLHAIANKIIQEKKNTTVVCASSEKFTLDFISSIQKNRTIEFSKSYRKADVLLIDDIQFFQGKEQTQEQFFHTFN